MAFTNDERVPAYSDKKIADDPGKTLDISTEGLSVREDNVFAQNDYHLIIQAFEKEAANWAEEDYAVAYHYKDVYSTRNFSERVQEQLNYYPGMHQTNSAPTTDPAYTKANEMANNRLNYWDNAMDNPDAFMNGLRSREQDFDYTKIFGSDASAQTRAEHIGKLVSECVPCFDRILDPGSLLPDGDLLEVHLLNVKLRTDLLDKLKSLLKDPGLYIDICEMLNLFSSLCPQDLLAMLALFTQYLAKLNLDIKFNIDFIIQLIGPLLSPFLDALTQWLDKWIAMIVRPMLCVVDHVNEVIMIAQNAKIPLSESSGSIDFDIGVADDSHSNTSANFSVGAMSNKGAWAEGELERFNTPQSEKYNPSTPVYPEEELAMAKAEMAEAWAPGFSEEERQARDDKWTELKEKQRKKERLIPPPERYPRRDGSRWSKDDIPNSQKSEYGFDAGYHPPEKQEASEGAKEALAYFDPSPLVSSIVQARNIMVGAIEYVKDWFTYATQMIYDLLGTDFGWMNKKMDTSILKSRLIQLIYMIKSILQAISKNGLRCGTNSNFDSDQLKFILEEGMNKFSPTKFKVLDNGDISIQLPDKPIIADALDLSKAVAEKVDGIDAGPDFGTIENRKIKQKSVQSGIIIKNCLKDVSNEELQPALNWIADFERRTNG